MMEGFTLLRAIQVVTGIALIAAYITGKIVEGSWVARMPRVTHQLMFVAGLFLLALGVFGKFPRLI